MLAYEFEYSWKHVSYVMTSLYAKMKLIWFDFKTTSVWSTVPGQALSWGTEERFQRLPQGPLKDLDIDISTWETLALDLSTRHSKITAAARAAETRRITEEQRNCAVCKAQATSTSTAVTGLMCPACELAFRQGPDGPH